MIKQKYSNKPFLKFGCFALSALSAGLFSSSSQAESQRPVQHVLMAFDGCMSTESWVEQTQFLNEMNGPDGQADVAKFTFLLSTPALLRNDKAHYYVNPTAILNESPEVMKDPSKTLFKERALRLKRGKTFETRGESNIGFGGSLEDVQLRVNYINKLHARGNEMGSHAAGHFDGKNWTKDMWRHEFDQFNRIMDNIGSINGDPDMKLNIYSGNMKGFRAPFLGSRNETTIAVLDEYNYRYDTSDRTIGWDSSNWPQKYSNTNVWNFGLAFIDVIGLWKPLNPGPGAPAFTTNPASGVPYRTLSMDYNFCFVQDNGCEYPYKKTTAQAKREASEDGLNMLKSYMKYFTDNYNGNRAPIHIGHHFTKYNDGAYNKAMHEFARVVCTLPEVKCTTYEKLADFMDVQSDENRKDYQYGRFKKARFQPSAQQLMQRIRWSH